MADDSAKVDALGIGLDEALEVVERETRMARRFALRITRDNPRLKEPVAQLVRCCTNLGRYQTTANILAELAAKAGRGE